MAKHYSQFKKYRTSFSFMGAHAFAKPGDGVSMVCPCGDIVVDTVRDHGDDELTQADLDRVQAHMEAHDFDGRLAWGVPS